MSAMLRKHSFNPDRINRYSIGDRVKEGGIINIQSESDAGSYINAINKGVLFDFDGSNMIIARVNPYTMSLVKSYIEKRR